MRVKCRSHRFVLHKFLSCHTYNKYNTRVHKLNFKRPVLTNLYKFCHRHKNIALPYHIFLSFFVYLYCIGPGFGAVGGSSDILLSSSASSSKPVGAIPTASPATSTSSYVPSRLDSALSSTYHPLLGTSPIPPITSSSSSMSTSGGGGGSGSLSMFLGQHQPGFPSSSIKVHSRSSPASSQQQQQQTQSVGSKLASSEWPDLGVSITSKSSTPGQWLPATTDTASTDSTTTKGMLLFYQVHAHYISMLVKVESLFFVFQVFQGCTSLPILG